MIERKINVASFDVFPNSTLKTSALQHYMQQMGREDCDEMGCTYIDMRNVNMVFVMTKMAIELSQPVYAYDEILIRTFNNRVAGVTFDREFEIFKNDEKIGHATTQWVIIKFDTRQIVRPKDFPFEIPAHGLDCGSLRLPRNIVAENLEFAEERKVRLSDLDENDHLNNCVYSDIAMDAIPYDRKEDFVKRACIIFKHEAKIGDVLRLERGENNGEFVINAYNSTSDMPCFESSYALGKING